MLCSPRRRENDSRSSAQRTVYRRLKTPSEKKNDKSSWAKRQKRTKEQKKFCCECRTCMFVGLRTFILIHSFVRFDSTRCTATSRQKWCEENCLFHFSAETVLDAVEATYYNAMGNLLQFLWANSLLPMTSWCRGRCCWYGSRRHWRHRCLVNKIGIRRKILFCYLRKLLIGCEICVHMWVRRQNK